MKKQKLITDTRWSSFVKKLSLELEAGWNVVPTTLIVDFSVVNFFVIIEKDFIDTV